MNDLTNYASTREKLKEICDLGLVSGKGTRAEPGQLCLESAVALALGEPHSDEPSCVHEVDRAFAITLNDARWPDPITRGRALYVLGCAQLGTAGTDRTEWTRRLVEGTIRRIVPIALRAAADAHPEELHQVALRDAADRCEADGSYAAASAAAYTSSVITAFAFLPGAFTSKTAFYARNAAHAASNAAAVTYNIANTAAYARSAAYAAFYAGGSVLTTAVEVALDAYRAEGRA